MHQAIGLPLIELTAGALDVFAVATDELGPRRRNRGRAAERVEQGQLSSRCRVDINATPKDASEFAPRRSMNDEEVASTSATQLPVGSDDVIEMTVAIEIDLQPDRMTGVIVLEVAETRQVANRSRKRERFHIPSAEPQLLSRSDSWR